MYDSKLTTNFDVLETITNLEEHIVTRLGLFLFIVAGCGFPPVFKVRVRYPEDAANNATHEAALRALIAAGKVRVIRLLANRYSGRETEAHMVVPAGWVRRELRGLAADIVVSEHQERYYAETTLDAALAAQT